MRRRRLVGRFREVSACSLSTRRRGSYSGGVNDIMGSFGAGPRHVHWRLRCTEGLREWRWRPNRRMAQSLHAAERDDSVPHPRDWRATVRERSPSIESADDDHKFEDESERDDRRLERARKRGRAAWEQARTAERQREMIQKLQWSLDTESQLRGKAEGVFDFT